MNRFTEVFYDEVNFMVSHAKWVNAMFDIQFVNKTMIDETEFTIEGTKNLQEIKEELYDLWINFCKENDILPNCIMNIAYVGEDEECEYDE